MFTCSGVVVTVIKKKKKNGTRPEPAARTTQQMGKPKTPSSSTTELELSEPRRWEGRWVVDVLRVSDEKLMGEIVLTPELLPPRTNKQGKVLWRLPLDDSAPRLGLNEQRAVFTEYRKQRKEKKDANRAVAKIQRKEDAKRKATTAHLAARIIQGAWRSRPKEDPVVRQRGPPPGLGPPVKDVRTLATVLASLGRDIPPTEKSRWVAAGKIQVFQAPVALAVFDYSHVPVSAVL